MINVARKAECEVYSGYRLAVALGGARYREMAPVVRGHALQ